MEMTHGDAMITLRTSTSSREDKLRALKVIFENEFETDYKCFKKIHMWELVRFLYCEVTKHEKL